MRRDDLEEQALFYMQVGSIAFDALLMTILGKIRLWLVDFSVLSSIVIRALVTYLLFKFIAEERPGFEDIDPKQLHDSIIFVCVPAFLCLPGNLRLELMVSAPLLLISTWLTTKSSYTLDGDNMSCYSLPETIGGQMASQSMCFKTEVHVIAILPVWGAQVWAVNA